MRTDDWLVLAYVMIFSSIILCGLLPMVFRLYNARRHYYHYHTEREHSEDSLRNQNSNSRSNCSDEQLTLSDINFQRVNSSERPIIYTKLPFIDDDSYI